VRWQCDTPLSCFIRNGSGGFVVASLSGDANNIDIVGFDVGNAPNGLFGFMAEWTGSAAQSMSGNSVHVIGNYFHDIAQTYNGPYGAGCPDTGMVQFLNQHGHYLKDPQVIGNRLTNFGRPASGGPCPVDGRQHGPGIYIIGTGATIENNIVSNSNNMGIQVYEQSCQAVVSNNIVFSNRNAGIIIGGGGPNCPANGNNTINNNIVVNNKGNGLAEVGGGSTGNDCSSSHPSLWSNNLTFGNSGAAYAYQGSCDTIANQKTEDPATTFVNYHADGSGDYHLKSGSVAINGGATSCVPGGQNPCTPSTDFDGKTRPRGAAIDIGAYEQ